MTMSGSAEGQTLGRHFNTVLERNMALWNSAQVVGGDS